MLPSVYLLLLAADPAAPPIRLPAELTGRPGRLVRLEAETPGVVVRWLVVGDADLVPLPGTKSAVLCGPAAGKLQVFAWTAAGDVPSEAARCVVTLGEPAPTDPLLADLKAAFAADPSPQKATFARTLAAGYRAASTASASSRTLAELYGVLKQQLTSLPTDALPAVRRRLADELNRTLTGDADSPLDAATRTTAGKLLARLAAALEELK